jgi:RNA polymerase sigma factor (TIGR02999 family)
MNPCGVVKPLVETPDPGGERASAELLPLVYDELRRMAAARMAREMPGQTLQPTALVHEVWLRLSQPGAHPWQNRAHFFAAASEAMRRILIENARRKSRLKRGGRHVKIDLEDVDPAAATPDDQMLMIDDAVERLEAEDAEKARVVVMKFFGGLTNQEVARSLGVTERTIERQWAFARAWLYEKIREQY